MGNRLYVGGLPYVTTEEELREAFSPAGNIASLSIITDRDSGQSRGFGFVEMASSEEAQAAIRLLNGTTLGGRPLTVNEANERPTGGGGRGNDRGYNSSRRW